MDKFKHLFTRKLNPCDIDHISILTPVEIFVTWLFIKLTSGTECECCLGTRVVALLFLFLLIGSGLTIAIFKLSGIL